MAKLQLERLPRSVELVRDSGGNAAFRYVDERLLPGELHIGQTSDWRSVVDAVKELAVRGAPAIGIAGAAALALWASESETLEQAESVAGQIAEARPTAVNLRWGVDKALAALRDGSQADAAERIFDFVKQMEFQDEAANRAIGANGAQLLPDGARILTHCNAGSLATCYYGTALGVVYAAAEQGKVARVYADETRPVGQGARLTTWELARAGDNMAASLMARGEVDAVIVGADRIAANGDTANKIGTYGVAVLAREHGVPFYVAAPTSTIDLAIADGSEIPIEERNASEVLPEPIEGVDVWNPAFDVTPARYITKLITEKGVFDPDMLAM